MGMKIEWIPREMRREKIFGLDAFRGLAALLVFLFHFWTIFWNEKRVGWDNFDLTTPFAAGHIGVDMFFVISGFLIFLSLVHSSSLKSYVCKRLLRIVPLAWFFTVVIFLLKQDFSVAGIWDGLAHLTFLQSFFPETYHGLNPVMWTLSVEALFYLLLPLLLFLGRKKWWHFWGILGMLTILNFFYRWYIIRFFPEWNQLERVFYSEQLWGRFDQFVMGIGLANLWLWKGKIEKYVQKKYSISVVTGLILLFFACALFAALGGSFRESVLLQLFLHTGVAFGFAIFLKGFLFAPRRVQEVLAPQPLQFFGKISYSVYLWHFPILLFFADRILNPLTAFAVCFLLTTLLSMLTFAFIEKPFLRRKAGKIAL